jgi:uncharacterized membrane protein
MSWFFKPYSSIKFQSGYLQVKLTLRYTILRWKDSHNIIQIRIELKSTKLSKSKAYRNINNLYTL